MASAQAPSPPLTLHERGSQGCSGVTVAVGGANGPPVDDDAVDDELADTEAAGAVLVVVLPCAPAPVPPVTGAAGGALTLKSVPVTTVTCEPGCTCEASLAMITAPDKELATAWAAASSEGA